jgi:NADH:ubiquinone oxidoreductase subunit D
MGIIEDSAPGLMVADLIAVFSSLDVVAPEIDR